MCICVWQCACGGEAYRRQNSGTLVAQVLTKDRGHDLLYTQAYTALCNTPTVNACKAENTYFLFMNNSVMHYGLAVYTIPHFGKR